MPANYPLEKDGRQFRAASVNSTLTQPIVMTALYKSGLFAESTLEKVNQRCNNPEAGQRRSR